MCYIVLLYIYKYFEVLDIWKVNKIYRGKVFYNFSRFFNYDWISLFFIVSLLWRVS